MFGFEWSIRYLWRSMGWFQRLDIIALILMLAYIVVVVTRVSCRCRYARRTEPDPSDAVDSFQRRRRKLVVNLCLEVSSLQSIAFAAPYLGLAGACIGVYHQMRFDIKMELALLTTAGGILVAIPAICSHNYLRTRIELLERGLASNTFLGRTGRPLHPVRRTALAKWPLQLSAFALAAAPILALLVAAETPYFSPPVPTGIFVELPSPRNQYEGGERLVVLRITNTGKLFLNLEPQEWNSAASRLWDIYRMRKHRTLYLVVEDAVPFQTVADAMDLVRGLTSTQPSLEIRVCLVTPSAISDRCPEPVDVDSGEGVVL
jgi:biopolymer transport protein ExbD